MNKKILIISYHFPPDNNIGGRRWYKFAKEFKSKGYDVNIFTTKPKKKNVNNTDFTYYHFNKKYPAILNTLPETLFSKIYYKITVFILNFIVKGTIYDRAIFLEKSFQKSLKHIIKENKIDTVIVTGAPFRLLYYTAQIKTQHPDFNLICDLRDPWTWGNGYGYNGLNKKNKEKEYKMEKQVLEVADLITVPVESMKDYLKETYPAQSSKLFLLPHCFDPKEFPNQREQKLAKKDRQKLKLIYGGTLYLGIENYLNEILRALNENNQIELDLYLFDNVYKNIFKKYDLSNIHFYNYVKPEELFRKINDSDYVLIIFPKEFKNYLSTKFCEIFFLQKPIIFISEEGYTSKFLIKNRLGFHLPLNEIYPTLKELNYLNFDYNYGYDYNQFSVEEVTKRLIHRIYNNS